MGALDRRPSITSIKVVIPDAIGRRPSATGLTSKIQIDVNALRRTKTAGSVPVRRASPPIKMHPSLSERAASSQTTLIEDDVNQKALEKLDVTDMELAPLSSSMSISDTSHAEVESLRSKLDMLELKLEEMTLKVHVP